jgi:phytoene dehydrogenase-like protein
VHPLAYASPLFRRLELQRFGLEAVESPSPLAHVFSPGRAVMLERSLDATCTELGADGPRYRALFEPFVERFAEL